MVVSSTWKLSDGASTATKNLQLTTLSYTRKGFEDPILDPNGGPGLNCGSGYAPSFTQPDVACTISGSELVRNSAVLVRNAGKSYGSGSSSTSILKNFNMTVPQGAIYSLLGSSGCGKTTVLSCVVGLKKLCTGQILVFGQPPESVRNDGSLIGYMPQELALYENMSISEILSFYGSLAVMSPTEILSRIQFLVKLLDLPDPKRRIDCLSCGQRRRVSLALTLIANPKLCILDEPTIGVDPLLRESIWEHLLQMSKKHGTTIVITTHYIEEAQRSDVVGLMRNGRLLTEENPQKLIEEHCSPSLNDIVIKLCKNDTFQDAFVRDEPINDVSSYNPNAISNRKRIISWFKSSKKPLDTVLEKTPYTDIPPVPPTQSRKLSFSKIKALTVKNWLLMIRNIWLMMLILMNPAFDVCLVNTAMGGEPSNLNFGYVNRELNETEPCLDTSEEYKMCALVNLSCRFIYTISSTSNTIKMHHFPDDAAALTAVDEGRIWGYVAFDDGYSDNLYERATGGLNNINETYEASNINVKMDATNRPVAAVILNYLLETYRTFIRGLLTDCGLNPDYGDIPLKILPPTHGSLNTNMKEFVAPGILLGILFFFPYCSGALVVIVEKKQGTLQRTQVAGASIVELMISFLLSQLVVLLIQSVSTFFLTTYFFGIEVAGSIPLGLMVSILIGIDGVSMGFFVASFCEGELEAMILGIGYFVANFIVSGTLWPLQASHPVMQYAAYLFPATLPSEAARSIISRGWGFTHPHVWPAFASELIRIPVFWILTLSIYKLSSKKK